MKRIILVICSFLASLTIAVEAFADSPPQKLDPNSNQQRFEQSEADLNAFIQDRDSSKETLHKAYADLAQKLLTSEAEKKRVQEALDTVLTQKLALEKTVSNLTTENSKLTSLAHRWEKAAKDERQVALSQIPKKETMTGEGNKSQSDDASAVARK